MIGLGRIKKRYRQFQGSRWKRARRGQELPKIPENASESDRYLSFLDCFGGAYGTGSSDKRSYSEAIRKLIYAVEGL